MNIFKKITLILFLFCIVFPARAMDSGNGDKGLFGRLKMRISRAVSSVFKPSIKHTPQVAVHERNAQRQSRVTQALESKKLLTVDYVKSELVALIKESDLASSYVEDDAKIDTFILADCAHLQPEDFHGFTQLHFAALFNRANLAKIIFENVQRQYVKDADGCTPLHWAARTGAADVVQLFCKAHVDLNAQTNDGDTAIHMLLEEGHSALLPQLLERGARIDLTNSSGQTALYVAVKKGNAQAVQCMLEQSLFCSLNHFKMTKVVCANLLEVAQEDTNAMQSLQQEIQKVIDARLSSIDALLQDRKIQIQAKDEIRDLVDPKKIEQYRPVITRNVIKAICKLSDAELDAFCDELEDDETEVRK
ncbi:MAG: ankyrin repeat domain-containing protein [Candidatus Babeliales bacterium]